MNYRIKNDLSKFWGILLTIAIVTYFMPVYINYIIFIVLIYKLFQSKKYYDFYIWVAVWFVLIDPPGDLFQNLGAGHTHQLPYFAYGTGFIGIRQILPIFFFIKLYYPSKLNCQNYLRKELYFLFALFLFYVFIGIIYGMRFNSFLNVGLLIILLSSYWSIPKLLSNNDLLNIDRLLFSMVFFAFVTQLLTLTTGFRLFDLFTRGAYIQQFMEIQEGAAARYISSPFILLYSLIKAFYYLFRNQRYFSTNYLIIVIAVVLFSIFLTATRGWIIGSIILVGLIFFIFGKTKNVKKIVQLIFIGLPLMAIIIITIPSLRIQITNVIVRFSTIELMLDGDLTAGGTVLRITERAPRVLAPFYERPIFGVGFSDIYWRKRDRHVGHPLMLLNNGIFGYIILNFVFFVWMYRMYSVSNKHEINKSQYGNSPKVLFIGMVFIYIIHSTSFMFWGFDLEAAPMFVIIMLISSYNSILIDMNNNKFLKRLNN